MNIFLSTIPTVGPGALKHREDTKLYGTEKEKNLFVAQDGFYRGAAEECVEAGIGINVFFFPSQYIDVATIGELRRAQAMFEPVAKIMLMLWCLHTLDASQVTSPALPAVRCTSTRDSTPCGTAQSCAPRSTGPYFVKLVTT